MFVEKERESKGAYRHPCYTDTCQSDEFTSIHELALTSAMDLILASTSGNMGW